MALCCRTGRSRMKADFMILSDIQKDIWQDFFIFVKNQDLTLWGGGSPHFGLESWKEFIFYLL